MTALHDDAGLQALLEEGLRAVETSLARHLADDSQVISEVTNHLSAAGGKRMRPALTLLVAQIGAPGVVASAEVVEAAVSVEMTHLATLYHDDVMDGAVLRRGRPAVQEQWANSVAIMAGDIIFARASRIVAGLGPDAVANHATTFERLCVGQLQEFFGPADGADKVAHYLDVLAGKTGSLVACAAQYGAELSGCSAQVVEAVKLFGEKIGVAFQLADDVLDLQSSGEVSGKVQGTDLREGVETMPVLLLERWVEGVGVGGAGAAGLGAEGASGEGQGSEESVLVLLSDLKRIKEFPEDEELIASVVERLAAHPVVDETREMARQYMVQAVDALDPVPDGPAKDALVAFAEAQINRMH
ncbi:MAG: polyprenyl synthetase family protein [Actinomycetaceae bacterium]|nr:polyprenyl synthetase family protein [Actinomycetaceae bacterium]